MSDENCKDELTRFLNGENSPQGERVFDRWYTSFEEDEQLPPVETQKLVDELRVIKRRRARGISIPIWLRYAAAVVIVSLTVGVLHTFNVSKHQEPLFAEIKVPAGRKATVQLEDGSEVVLNAGSFMRYPAHFTDTLREVFLDGEGFFSIAKDSLRPFIVRSNDMAVQVLGTSFNVKSFANERSASVVVMEGKVSVSYLANESIVMKPNDRFTVNKRSGEIVTSVVDALPYRFWIDGKLFFDDTPAAEVIAELSRRFDVKIDVLGYAETTCRITASFERMPVEGALELICQAIGTSWEKSASGYIVNGYTCPK